MMGRRKGADSREVGIMSGEAWGIKDGWKDGVANVRGTLMRTLGINTWTIKKGRRSRRDRERGRCGGCFVVVVVADTEEEEERRGGESEEEEREV